MSSEKICRTFLLFSTLGLSLPSLSCAGFPCFFFRVCRIFLRYFEFGFEFDFVHGFWILFRLVYVWVCKLALKIFRSARVLKFSLCLFFEFSFVQLSARFFFEFELKKVFRIFLIPCSTSLADFSSCCAHEKITGRQSWQFRWLASHILCGRCVPQKRSRDTFRENAIHWNCKTRTEIELAHLSQTQNKSESLAHSHANKKKNPKPVHKVKLKPKLKKKARNSAKKAMKSCTTQTRAN